MLGLRQMLDRTLPTFLLLSGLGMAWSAARFLAHSSTPILVVTSESMAPAFHRGDVILLSNRSEAVSVGDIPVVWFPGHAMPFVHRAVKMHWELVEGSLRSVTTFLRTGSAASMATDLSIAQDSVC